MLRARKRLIALVLALALVGAVVAAAAFGDLGDPEVPSDAAAVIEGAPDGEIPDREVQRAIDDQIQQQEELGIEISRDDQLYRDVVSAVLQGPILVRWFLGEAEDRDILITDDDVDEFIREQGGLEVFAQQIVAQGLYAVEAEEVARASVAQLKLFEEADLDPESLQRQQQALEQDTSRFTDEEIEAAYDELLAIARSDPTQVTAAQIVGLTPEERDLRQVVTDNEADAEAALEELEQDDSTESWKAVVKKYSIDPVTSETGGLRRGVPDPEAAAALGSPASEVDEQTFAAEVGELVGPFEAEGSFYVIQVVDVKEEQVGTLEEATPDVALQLLGREQERALEAFENELIGKWTARTICADDYREANFCGNGEPVDDSCPVDDSRERKVFEAQAGEQVLESQIAAGCEAFVTPRLVAAPTRTGAFAEPLMQGPPLRSPAELVAEAVSSAQAQLGTALGPPGAPTAPPGTAPPPGAAPAPPPGG